MCVTNYEFSQSLTSSLPSWAEVLPNLRARDCDVFFIDTMNNRRCCQPWEWQKSWNMEGGGPTSQLVLTLTWFASGCYCCQICARPIWMAPVGPQIATMKSNLRCVCFQSNLIPFRQARWSVLPWEPSCQVALKSTEPLVCELKTLTDHNVKVPGQKRQMGSLLNRSWNSPWSRAWLKILVVWMLHVFSPDQDKTYFHINTTCWTMNIYC